MSEILMGGATGIFKKLVDVVSEDIALDWDVKDDLEKLQSTSEMILAVISDAEKRQEKEELVRLWLRKLKDIAYDADDVIDEFSYEHMRLSDQKDSSKHKVLDLTSSSKLPHDFHIKIRKKIKDINKRLEEITNDIDRFQLEFATPIPDGESTEQLDRQDTSYVDVSKIVGRENDEFQIRKLLTTNNSSCFVNPNQYHEKICVICIVGMGGLGKTTLAELVYDDELVNIIFDLTIWVHVSEVFDIEIMLVNIMESITKTKFHNPSNFHVLVNAVQKQLNGKKYLLVLDDLWNEDSEQWGRLMTVLLPGSPGSKILITTRNDQVASIVGGSIPPYNLNLLHDDACWSIIKQKAFSSGGALNAPQMTYIGKEIAKKCCGLPLAAHFLGSLMHLKNKESDWISIRDDDMWNAPESKTKLLSILSYNNLPSHLKQCFAYCSIFPKNWLISKEALVHLWMAEGFLKQSDIRNQKPVEDLGSDYFESLAWGSFFHNFKRNTLGDIQTCKMHDLVHDLAEDVLGHNELVSVRASDLKNVSEFRRLKLILDEDLPTTFMESLGSTKKLRTLFIPESLELNRSILSEDNHLRILHMGCSPVSILPELSSFSVKLRHLRYLHLSSIDVRKVVNGQPFDKLYNLETLSLTNIHGVQYLLTNIQSSQNLRHLELSNTDIEKVPDSVTSLCHLQTLVLKHCEKLKRFPESVTGLKYLRFLDLSFTPIEELPVFLSTLFDLQALDVNNCKNLKALPEYVAHLANLRIFNFKYCPLLKALPVDLGALTQLRYLSLVDTGIKVLPESFANLSNIVDLNLSKCELPKDVIKNLSKLRKFYYFHRGQSRLSGVGKLVFLEEFVYSVPKKLVNEPDCNDGIEELGNLNFLEALGIGDLQNVIDPIDAERAYLKGKENLQFLSLIWDETDGSKDKELFNYQVFEALQPHTSLRKLEITNFRGSDLPNWMHTASLPNLEKLKLHLCDGIKQLPAAIGQFPRLTILDLASMSLKSLDIGGFASLVQLKLTDMFLLEELCYSHPCLQLLYIKGCKRLSNVPFFPSLEELQLEMMDLKLVSIIGRSHNSLTKLFLKNMEITFFSLNILQNYCNLQLLHINECKQFQGFRAVGDEKDNESHKANTCSLQQLVLLNCPVLKFLPDLRGWASLQKLYIFYCPQVKESLTYDLRTLSFVKEMYVDFIMRGE